VKLTVCKDGNVKDYIVDMAWSKNVDDKSKYDLGVPIIEEPYWHPTAKNFEVFAGITVAEMTVNHVLQLIQSGADPRLGRYLDPEARKEKKLLIVHAQAGTYASHVVGPGMIVAKINGRNVTGLDTWIEAVFLGTRDSEFTLETEEGAILKLPFAEEYQQQMTMGSKVPQFHYLLTRAICLKGVMGQLMTKLQDPQTLRMLDMQLQNMKGRQLTKEELFEGRQQALAAQLAQSCHADPKQVEELLKRYNELARAQAEKRKQLPAEASASGEAPQTTATALDQSSGSGRGGAAAAANEAVAVEKKRQAASASLVQQGTSGSSAGSSKRRLFAKDAGRALRQHK